MKVCGIIAEYDPFHRGHLYHLEQARRQSGADYLVCVLGCAFSQRGDPMLFSSHDRARMALENGFDLVLGMPVSFSCAQANRFAAGGVGILNRLGVVTHLSFGSEHADLGDIQKAARLLNRPDALFAGTLRTGLAQGHSFAKAQGLALEACLKGLDAQVISAPNFILAVSYLRELDKLGNTMEALPVQRAGDYHKQSAGLYAPASAVREMLRNGEQAQAAAACPPQTMAILQTALPHPPGALDKALLYSLLYRDAQSLQAVPEVSEGLEQRILAMARKAISREDLLDLVKTRRYPRARINRALSQALIGQSRYTEYPAYARLLGFRSSAKPLLGAIAEHGFPLVSRPVRGGDPELRQDLRAEELWYLGSGQKAAAAYQQQVIIIKQTKETGA